MRRFGLREDLDAPEECPECGSDLTELYRRPEVPSITYDCGSGHWVVHDHGPPDGTVTAFDYRPPEERGEEAS